MQDGSKDLRLPSELRTYVEQQVEPAESVDRLLEETLDERFVGDVTIDEETLLWVRTGSFRLLQLGQTPRGQR